MKDLCHFISVSSSGYYAWSSRPESKRISENRILLAHIRRIHTESHEAYGYLKTWHALKQEGISCGRHRVARLRKENGIEAKRKRRFRTTCRTRHNYPASPDMLKQAFYFPDKDKAWVGDTTFIPTRSERLYLAVMLDLYSRRIVGWAMGAKNDQELVGKALTMAIQHRKPKSGLIHHSDQGATYTSASYRKIITSNGLVSSMSRKGKCHDNAVVESFFSNLKNELIYNRNFKNRDEATLEIFKYIEIFYNRKRIHAYLGYQSPVSFESNQHVP